MVFAAYLLEIQFWCCPRAGHLYPISKPHRGAFAVFPKQSDKKNTQQMPRGEGGIELTEPLIKNVILQGKLSILCDI